jgi:hydroxyacylglutathione hydrolase
MTLRAVVVPVTPFAQNCSVIWCDVTGQGAVIDPGGDLDRILDVVDSRGVKLEKILLTHAHIDHAGAVAELPQQGKMFGLGRSESFEPTRWLEQGDAVTVGDVTLDVRHCPGHTPGHVVFFEPRARLAFVGDVLFAGSIGRTDFPRGDHATLLRSIRENLFPLGDDVRFVPGHGPMSTFGEERKSNPFVGDRAVGG